MKFAIAIPVLEQERFLPSALASIRAQREAFELAILDATPTDSVQRVIADSGQRVDYSRHGPDQGQSAAIAEGWNNIDGNIVAWLCADDYYFPGAFARVARTFAEHPDVDVVYGHAAHISRTGEFLEYFPAIDEDIGNLRLGCCISQPACFVRRRSLERVGGLDVSMQFTMDWDLWLRLRAAGARFRFIDAPLAAVRVYPETKTLSRAPERYAEISELLHRYASKRERIISMMGFRLYDLVHHRTTALDYAVYGLLRGIRSLRRRAGGRTILGLECWTNRVQGCCEVQIPWYNDEAPNHATILAGKVTSLECTVAGARTRLSSAGIERTEFAGREVTACLFEVPLAAREDRLVRIGISADVPWVLYGVRFATRAALVTW